MSATPILIGAAVGALLGVLFVLWLRRRFAPGATALPSWQAKDVAYQADPDMRLACEHLRPLENAARASGHPVHVEADYWATLTVGAIEPTADRLASLALPDCITREPPRIVRPYEDTGVVFRCTLCGDGIGFDDISWAHQVPAFEAPPRTA